MNEIFIAFDGVEGWKGENGFFNSGGKEINCCHWWCRLIPCLGSYHSELLHLHSGGLPLLSSGGLMLQTVSGSEATHRSDRLCVWVAVSV